MKQLFSALGRMTYASRPALEGASNAGVTAVPVRHRVEYIDGLRCIAVLLVFLTHATELAASGNIVGGEHLKNLAHTFDFGRVGVVTFFAISGFLIPSSLKGDRVTGSAWFLVSRFFRLYPAFWVAVLVASAAFPLRWGHDLPGSVVLRNLTMIPEFLDVTMADGAYWTLQVELLFYAFCLFLFTGGLLSNTFVLAALSFFGGFVFFSSQQVLWGGFLNPSLGPTGFSLCLHLSIMFWGALMRQRFDGVRFEPVAALMFWAVTAYWLLVMPMRALVPLMFGALNPALDYRLVSGYSLGIGIFFVGVMLMQPRSRVMAWFGRISYSFYLLHGPWLWITAWLTRTEPHLAGHWAGATILFAFVATTLSSAALHYGIERPGIALGRRIGHRATTSVTNVIGHFGRTVRPLSRVALDR